MSREREDLAAVFRREARPLVPVPTGVRPVLAPCEGVGAVFFDVYGTLLVSAAGEVGTAAGGRAAALAAALAAVGLELRGPAAEAAALLDRAVRGRHAAARRAGVGYPEVEIREVWREVLSGLAAAGRLGGPRREVAPARLAVEYEARANPTWPMPGVQGLLRALREGGVLLGLVSNAQFFTPLVLEVQLGGPLETLGFAPDLIYWSHEYARAKPGAYLYEQAAAALRRRGLQSVEALHVGNDMLNDVVPARAVGFRTALFAGDGRSLRWRRGDPRVGGARPDLVLTDWAQLSRCILRWQA